MTYAIPNFSRYVIQDPFQVWDTQNNRAVSVTDRKHGRGNPSIHLIDDTGKRRTLSVVTVACLAYRGLPPKAHMAFHTGGAISKTTVRWISKSEYQSNLRSTLTLSQKDRIIELYFSGKYTQEQLADKFDSSQPAISRIINKMGKRS